MIDTVKINSENFSEFIALIRELAGFEKLDPPDENAAERLRIHGLGNDPKYQGYLAYVDNKPVGYLIYFFTYSSFLGKPTLYIEDIFVKDKVRSQGVGSRIFGFCLEKAKENSCGRMEWTALRWNKKAHGFYGKWGAKKLSDWITFRMTEDDIAKVK
ncbi:MAG: GNAT family N-acetyltransferase [archaeon]